MAVTTCCLCVWPNDNSAAITAAACRLFLSVKNRRQASMVAVRRFAEPGSTTTSNRPAKLAMSTRLRRGEATLPTVSLAALARRYSVRR